MACVQTEGDVVRSGVFGVSLWKEICLRRDEIAKDKEQTPAESVRDGDKLKRFALHTDVTTTSRRQAGTT